MRIFDSHFHVIDPRFPLVANAGYLPEPFKVDDYLLMANPLGVVGGVVVSGSYQAWDRTYLEDALECLGPGFVGVAQLPEQATEREIRRLDGLGVRALRFNLKRGVFSDPRGVERLACRAYDAAGWHAELYLDAGEIPDLLPLLERLPAVCIDHLGLSAGGFRYLLGLVEKGAHVKATGFGRVDFPVADALRSIVEIDPNALLFGTDLPCTRAPRPFDLGDLALITDTLQDEALVSKVLFENAVDFYHPVAVPG